MVTAYKWQRPAMDEIRFVHSRSRPGVVIYFGGRGVSVDVDLSRLGEALYQTKVSARVEAALRDFAQRIAAENTQEISGILVTSNKGLKKR